MSIINMRKRKLWVRKGGIDMNLDIKELTKSFQSKTRNRKERFKEFCAHCWYVYDKEIKSKKSKRMINKYNIMRKNTLQYIIDNEKLVTFEISK